MKKITENLMVIHKALHRRDDIDIQYVSIKKKEEEDSLTRRPEDYLKKSKEN